MIDVNQFLEEEKTKGNLMYQFSLLLLELGNNLEHKGSEIKIKLKKIKQGVALISEIIREQKKRIKTIKLEESEKTTLSIGLSKQTKALLDLYDSLINFKTEESYEETNKIDNVKSNIEEYKLSINKTQEFLKALKLKKVTEF